MKKQEKQFKVGNLRWKINNYIELWKSRCYTELPDEAPLEIDDMVPSYKRIALCLLRNDIHLCGLGYSKSKSKLYDFIKKDELKKRGIIIQLNLFE